jgi:hypothetical protein
LCQPRNARLTRVYKSPQSGCAHFAVHRAHFFVQEVKTKFSFLSWNVRQYKGSVIRLIDAIITKFNPIIFGLIEFRAKKVQDLMFNNFV